MEYRLCCVQHKENKYVEINKRFLTEEEFFKLKNAVDNINKFKLLYEVPYTLKCNYAEFWEYIKTKLPQSGSQLWNVNKKILETNRLIFNLVSSLNAIESHYKKLLDEDDFNNDLKSNFISKHYDESLEYRFLYQLRNYVNHSSVPATLAEFRFDSEINYDKVLANKESFVNDNVFKAEVKKDISEKYPDKIDISAIIQKEIPEYIKILLEYLSKYHIRIVHDINFIKEYQKKLTKRVEINSDTLIYGVANPEVPNTLNLVLPVDFIKCYENNELYADLNKS